MLRDGSLRLPTSSFSPTFTNKYKKWCTRRSKRAWLLECERSWLFDAPHCICWFCLKPFDNKYGNYSASSLFVSGLCFVVFCRCAVSTLATLFPRSETIFAKQERHLSAFAVCHDQSNGPCRPEAPQSNFGYCRSYLTATAIYISTATWGSAGVLSALRFTAQRLELGSR